MSDYTALIRKRRKLNLDGIEITVYALPLEQIGALIAEHSALAAALEDTDGDIVKTISEAGPAAIADMVIAATGGAIPREVALEIDALAAVEILTATVDITLPEQEERLGNAMAEVARLFRRIASASGTSSKS